MPDYTEEDVERVARAICRQSQGNDGSWREWTDEARAALDVIYPLANTAAASNPVPARKP